MTMTSNPFLEESCLNAYVNECHELEPVHTVTNRVRTILDVNNTKADSNTTINGHCQRLTVTKQEQLLILLNKYKMF